MCAHSCLREGLTERRVHCSCVRPRIGYRDRLAGNRQVVGGAEADATVAIRCLHRDRERAGLAWRAREDAARRKRQPGRQAPAVKREVRGAGSTSLGERLAEGRVHGAGRADLRGGVGHFFGEIAKLRGQQIVAEIVRGDDLAGVERVTDSGAAVS